MRHPATLDTLSHADVYFSKKTVPRRTVGDWIEVFDDFGNVSESVKSIGGESWVQMGVREKRKLIYKCLVFCPLPGPLPH